MSSYVKRRKEKKREERNREHEQVSVGVRWISHIISRLEKKKCHYLILITNTFVTTRIDMYLIESTNNYQIQFLFSSSVERIIATIDIEMS